MGGCWVFLSPDRYENPGFDSVEYFSINDFWSQGCLRKPLPHPCPYALLLWLISMNFPGWRTLSNSRCEWKNNPFLSYSSNRPDPASAYNAAPQAFVLAEQQRGGRTGRHSQRGGKGAAKAPLGSAAALPLNDCDHVTQLNTYILWSYCHHIHSI